MEFGIQIERLSDADAGKVYFGLCEGTIESPRSHPAVDAFYQELTAKLPEVDAVPDDSCQPLATPKE